MMTPIITLTTTDDTLMLQLLELAPIVLFFAAFMNKGSVIEIGDWSHQLDGIYSATAVLMIATCIQVALTFALTKRIERRLILLFLVVMITGGLTLILHNKIFIQWKPTIFNGALALAFFCAPFIGTKKTVLERTLGAQLELPLRVWTNLNILWITNFVLAGVANIYVAYGYSEETWVSYKLYSSIGFTGTLSIITALMIAPHLKEENQPKS